MHQFDAYYYPYTVPVPGQVLRACVLVRIRDVIMVDQGPDHGPGTGHGLDF